MSVAPLCICVIVAWCIAFGWLTRASWPFYRPVAWLLTVGLFADALRWVRVAAGFAAGERPYTGVARALYHVEQALWTSWPFALVVAALVVFARRPWWPAVAAWCACVAGLALAYPWLRQARLGVAYAAVTAACAAVVLWPVVLWLAVAHRRRGEAFIAHHAALLILAPLSALAAVVLAIMPWHPLWWMPARAVYAVMFVALGAYQARQMWRYRR
jgi:hypothetical protein